MATYTENYNLEKPDLNETADIEVINNNMNIIDTEFQLINDKVSLQNMIYPTTGTANTYSITIPNITSYNDLVGTPIMIKINLDSTGVSSINVNSYGTKALKKANGNDMVTFKANGIYTIVFDNVNFILQGEGGEYGNATQNDVKLGVTFGTETGVQIGTYTSDATALAENIDNGKIAYGNGQRIVGTSTKKQWAIVTATSSADNHDFSSRSGSIYKPYVYYSGLPFTPSIIILCTTGGDMQSFVNLKMPLYLGQHWIQLFLSGAMVQIDSQAFISGGSFRLPVDAANIDFTITVIE